MPAHQPKAWYRQCPSAGMRTMGPGCEASPSLRYGMGVFEPANTIALRFELSRKLYLEAASGLASSLDLFYQRDF